MLIHQTTSLDVPDLEPYRTLREKTHHWRDGFFVAEGEKVVRRLFASGREVVSILLSPAWFDELRATLEEPRFEALDVYVAEDALLESITGLALHKRLMAIGRIPPSPDLDALSAPLTGSNLHVAIEGLADAENMGIIARNCAAFGVESLLTGEDSTNPWLRRSVRVSMGTIFSLRTHRSPSLLETLSELRDRHGWTLIGTTPRGGDTSLARLTSASTGPVCLVFGSEGRGLSTEALAACDGLYTIPMYGAVDSLNVANALAVALFAAQKDGLGPR
ncbi:MAG: RNA methyltransferase [Ignavibacteriae bacterium]|nr:RNA methyltransferase [Ignavibacteriota bacterium]